jgi:hypothetical protein
LKLPHGYMLMLDEREVKLSYRMPEVPRPLWIALDRAL